MSIIDAVLIQAELFNDISAKIIPGKARRVEKQSYPGSSLREAVLNAFCHADFSRPSNIILKFSAKEVAITSPGSLYKITLEEMLQGAQTYRNPNLIKVLNRLGYIENFGRGIERIIDAYENETRRQSFLACENFFKVILPNLNYNVTKGVVTE